MDRKIIAYLYIYHSYEYEFTYNNGPIRLRDDGDGIVKIDRWDVPYPQPTMEELAQITEEQIIQALKDIDIGKFEKILNSLLETEPKLALVYEMFKTLCLQKLNMTEQEWYDLSFIVYTSWVNKRYTPLSPP